MLAKQIVLCESTKDNPSHRSGHAHTEHIKKKGATVDTSNGAKHTLDYVLGRISDPVDMGRDEYAKLFEYVSDLIYPFLSKLGMKRLSESGGALSYKLKKPLDEANMADVRLILAQQSPSLMVRNRPDWEVYLTEKGHWVVVLSRKREGDVRIISNKDEFLQYYDRQLETGFIPPYFWLLEAPHFVVDRAMTIMAAKFQSLEYLEDILSHLRQRFFIVNNGGSTSYP